MKTVKESLIALAVLGVTLLAVFSTGHFGWRLSGFRACQEACIAPRRFLRILQRGAGRKAFCGFRFRAVFGIFETGDFDVKIPVKGEINEVILKTSTNKTALPAGVPVPFSNVRQWLQRYRGPILPSLGLPPPPEGLWLDRDSFD